MDHVIKNATNPSTIPGGTDKKNAQCQVACLAHQAAKDITCRAADRHGDIKIERLRARRDTGNLSEINVRCDRPIRRFSDAHEEPRCQQETEFRRQSRNAGRQAPSDHSAADDGPAAHAVSQPAKERRRKHVGGQERGGQQAHPEVDMRIELQPN